MKHKRARLVLWIAIVLVASLPLAANENAKAASTFYAVQGLLCLDVAVIQGGSPRIVKLWDDADCWASSSGGMGGVGVPGPGDTAIFDANSNGVVNRDFWVNTTEIDALIFDGYTRELRIGFTAEAVFTVGDIQSLSGFGSIDVVGTIEFSGTISAWDDGAPTLGIFADLAESGTEIWASNISHTGVGAFVVMPRIEYSSMIASKTIYCFPDCADDGGNVNIIFGPPPGPSPGSTGSVCEFDNALPGGGFLALVVLIICVGILIAVINSVRLEGFEPKEGIAAIIGVVVLVIVSVPFVLMLLC